MIILICTSSNFIESEESTVFEQPDDEDQNTIKDKTEQNNIKDKNENNNHVEDIQVGIMQARVTTDKGREQLKDKLCQMAAKLEMSTVPVPVCQNYFSDRSKS